MLTAVFTGHFPSKSLNEYPHTNVQYLYAKDNSLSIGHIMVSIMFEQVWLYAGKLCVEHKWEQFSHFSCFCKQWPVPEQS